MSFEALFRSGHAGRDNFRSRLFGMFNEEIVRCWAANVHAPYRDLGRPTLWTPPEFATLDFTLQSRADGRSCSTFAEGRWSSAFEGYRYLRLTAASQVQHHATKRAFLWFLDVAREPASHLVKVGARPMAVSGAILVWGAVQPAGRADAIETYGFEDVLAIEACARDLRELGRFGLASTGRGDPRVGERPIRRADVVTTSATERLRALAKYEAIFAAPGFTFGHWVDPTPGEDGVVQMGWYASSDAAQAFVDEAYALEWVIDFDWMKWAASPKGRRLLADPGLVGRASAADLARLLTVFIRGDRYSEGELAGAYDLGMLGAIVRRAAELAESS